MLIVVIVIGLLYALPNLFGEDPAVQITGARGVAASEQTLIQVQKTLQEEKITAKSVALEEGAILARFDSTDTQLRAREALMGVMGDKYVVALNLAPATPRWLAAIHAEPMKLGLDLRGGVHFLTKEAASPEADKIIKKLLSLHEIIIERMTMTRYRATIARQRNTPYSSAATA